MALRDPTTEVEPDFDGEEWGVAREAFIRQGDSQEEAVRTLQKAWRDQHQRNLERWEEHLQQEQQDRTREEGGQAGQEAAPAAGPQPEVKRPDWLNHPTPSFLDIRPARHILKRLEKKEFVELWHFTVQGCQDAAHLDLSTSDDTFSLVNTGGGLMLQSVGASATSSKAVKDELLNFEQWVDGKERMISCMETHNWEKYEVQELALFFFRLVEVREARSPGNTAIPGESTPRLDVVSKERGQGLCDQCNQRWVVTTIPQANPERDSGSEQRK